MFSDKVLYLGTSLVTITELLATANSSLIPVNTHAAVDVAVIMLITFAIWLLQKHKANYFLFAYQAFD